LTGNLENLLPQFDDDKEADLISISTCHFEMHGYLNSISLIDFICHDTKIWN